jgi:hypothetical protein
MRTTSGLGQLQITVGDLVVAIMDAALEVAENESKAYQIAGLALNRVLRVSLSGADKNGPSSKWLQ